MQSKRCFYFGNMQTIDFLNLYAQWENQPVTPPGDSTSEAGTALAEFQGTTTVYKRLSRTTNYQQEAKKEVKKVVIEGLILGIFIAKLFSTAQNEKAQREPVEGETEEEAQQMKNRATYSSMFTKSGMPIW